LKRSDAKLRQEEDARIQRCQTRRRHWLVKPAWRSAETNVAHDPPRRSAGRLVIFFIDECLSPELARMARERGFRESSQFAGWD